MASSIQVHLYSSSEEKDCRLAGALMKHLDVLTRKYPPSQLVLEYFPRDMKAGETEDDQIDSSLETADIIILLLSSDFLASDDLFTQIVEPAIKLHEDTFVRVIPVLLRRVDWKIPPLEKLQILPSNGKAVNHWKNKDDILYDVALSIKHEIDKLIAVEKSVSDGSAVRVGVPQPFVASMPQPFIAGMPQPLVGISQPVPKDEEMPFILERTLKGHLRPVTSVIFTPGGETLVSDSLDHTIKVWNVARRLWPVRGRLRRNIGKHLNPIYSIALSSDMQRLISAGEEKTIKVWDFRTGLPGYPPLLEGHENVVSCVAITPDGNTLVSASDDKTIRVWNLRTGQERCPPLKGHTAEVSCVAITADGRTIISGSYDGTVRLWDISTGEQLQYPNLRRYAETISCVAVSPDMTTVASGRHNGIIRIWDLRTGQERRALIGHSGAVYSIAFHPDGDVLVSGGQDHVVIVWSCSTRYYQPLPKGHTAEVLSVAFHPTKNMIASGSFDKTINLWSWPKTMKLFASTTPGVKRTPIREHAISRRAFAIGAAGVGLAAGGFGLDPLVSSLTSHVQTPGHIPAPIFAPHPISIPEGHLVYTHVEYTKELQIAGVRAVAWSPGGGRIASGGFDKTVQVWNAVQKSNAIIYTGHSEDIWWIAWSPDGQYIASASHDRSVQVWQAANDQFIYGWNHKEGVRTVAWSPDGQYIASGSFDGTVQVWHWNRTRSRLIHTYRRHNGPVGVVAWSPDSRLIASGSDDNTVQIWRATDTHDDHPIYTYRGHRDSVGTASWSPDGERIASGSQDTTVQVWNAADGSNARTYQGTNFGLVWSVGWSPSGRYIASGYSDNTVRVWDTVKNNNYPYKGHADQVSTVAWSPDRRRLIASGSYDGTVQVWQAV